MKIRLEAVPLSDIIVSRLDEADVDSIVNRAINEAHLTGRELHSALVVSGVALGVEKVQMHVMNLMNAQMGLMRKTLAAIDAKLADSQGDDAMSAFIASVRHPMVERLREHLGMVVAAFVQHAEQAYGIDQKTLLSPTPADEMFRSDLLLAGASASYVTSMAFYGFILSDAATLEKNPSLHDLVGIYRAGHAEAEEIVKEAIGRFGSMDETLIAYGRFCIAKIQHEVKEFEDGYGNLDDPTLSSAVEATNQVLARYLAGSGKPGGPAEGGLPGQPG